MTDVVHYNTIPKPESLTMAAVDTVEMVVLLLAV